MPNPLDPQQLAVYVIVALAAVYLARSFFVKKKGGCGSCDSCPSDATPAEPIRSELIQLDLGPLTPGSPRKNGR